MEEEKEEGKVRKERSEKETNALLDFAAYIWKFAHSLLFPKFTAFFFIF